MPKEQPLQALIPLQLILEPKPILLIRKLEQIQQLRARLHDGKRRALGVVDDDGDAAVGVEAEEPFLLLLVGGDVDDGLREGCAVGVGQLFEEDLDLLTVGGAVVGGTVAVSWSVLARWVGIVKLRHGGVLDNLWVIRCRPLAFLTSSGVSEV